MKKSKNSLKVTLSGQDEIVPDTHNYVTVIAVCEFQITGGAVRTHTHSHSH